MNLTIIYLLFIRKQIAQLTYYTSCQNKRDKIIHDFYSSFYAVFNEKVHTGYLTVIYHFETRIPSFFKASRLEFSFLVEPFYGKLIQLFSKVQFFGRTIFWKLHPCQFHNNPFNFCIISGSELNRFLEISIFDS